jgi:hypothetical protein
MAHLNGMRFDCLIGYDLAPGTTAVAATSPPRAPAQERRERF